MTLIISGETGGETILSVSGVADRTISGTTFSETYTGTEEAAIVNGATVSVGPISKSISRIATVNDPRFVSLVFDASTTDQLNITTTYTVNSFHRFRYRVTGTTVDFYSVEDTSGLYAEHGLDITGLTDGTSYDVWPQTSDDNGATWFDVTATAFTNSTASAAASNDPRFVSLVFAASTTTQLNITTSYTVNSFHRFRYRVAGSTVDQYTVEDTSGLYSVHGLDVTGLTAGTSYQVWPQTSDDNGVTWFDVTATAFTNSTAAVVATGSYAEITEADWVSANGSAGDNASYSTNWTGSNGFVSDGGSTDAWRVKVGKSENYGATRKWEGFPTGTKEVKFRYRLFVPTDYESYWKGTDQNMKIPGLTGDVGTLTGGYGGSSGSDRDKADRAWSARLQMHRPGTTYPELALGMELYWPDSPTNFGDTEWFSLTGSVSTAETGDVGTWFEIEQHLRMNDHGVANGFLHNSKDGVIEYSKTNFEFSDAADMLVFGRAWLDFYHGGIAKASDGDLYLFARKFEYQIVE